MNTVGQAGPLRILHLEDNANDVELVRLMLQDEGLVSLTRQVDTREDFEAALGQGNWDLILSDFTLPSYDGMTALALTRQKMPGVPFILFSGTIGEELAVQSLKNGAADYIIKQRPVRLVPAIRHALEESAERRRRERMEKDLLEAEKRKKELETQFLRMQRMDSIGALVGGIAHDLNNALVPVLVGVGLLRSRPPRAHSEQILLSMEACANRSANMLRQVLTFARGVEGKQAAVDVGSLLREMDRIVRDIFPKSIEWRLSRTADLWPVSGHATQLHQVLMNLCINARDAMPEGGQLAVLAENIVLDPAAKALHPEALPGPYLCIRVADTGIGMPPEVLQNVFQPFFTTKAPGKGTGLGLATSLNIVKDHGGFITVDSAPGRGSTFRVYLPAMTRAAAGDTETTSRGFPAGSGEWILVVDDEMAICEIAKAALENYGYHVLVAASGPEAIAIFAEKRQKIALVITDTAMPFMDGRATSLALRRIKPDLKLIVTSGGGEKEHHPAFRLRTDAVIPKPYTIEKLLTTVHEVLIRTSGRPA